jgi:hypothetical protein
MEQRKLFQPWLEEQEGVNPDQGISPEWVQRRHIQPML